MKLTKREAQREARKRNDVAKRLDRAIRHRAVSTRYFSTVDWKYHPCWTVVMAA